MTPFAFNFKTSTLALLFSCVLLSIDNVSAGFKIGRCAEPEVVTNFDVERYTGLWYEISRDQYALFELFAKCVTAKYTTLENGNIRVRNNSYYQRTNWTGVTGEAALEDPSSGEANLIVAFGGDAPTGDVNYQVIDTDYDTYAVVYSGSSLFRGFACAESLWVLSRTPELSEEALSKAKASIAQKVPKYDYEGLARFTLQGDTCPYDDQPE